MIILNLKTYSESIEKALLFADIASDVVEETGIRIIVCPPVTHLKETAERFSQTFAQHSDNVPLGAYTGSLPVEALKHIKVKGSLVNHSEKRMKIKDIKKTIDQLHQHGLESLVCVESPKEAEEISQLNPTYIAIEPPELIGSGISVSTARPEIVIDSVSIIKKSNPNVTVLCGAGISNKEDTKKALELGTTGVLLASAFVKAKEPKEFLLSLTSVF